MTPRLSALVLRPSQLTVNDDLHTVGFYVPSPASRNCASFGAQNDEGANFRFVPASHVSAASLLSPFSPLLRVEFEQAHAKIAGNAPGTNRGELHSRMVPGASRARAIAPDVSSVGKAGPPRRPPLSRYPRGIRLKAAWAVNLMTLAATWLGVMLALLSSEQQENAQLVASSLAKDNWRLVAWKGIILACAESFILIDGIKVLVLTLTSSHALERALPEGSWRRRLARKPLRRIHMVVDVLL